MLEFFFARKYYSKTTLKSNKPGKHHNGFSFVTLNSLSSLEKEFGGSILSVKAAATILLDSSYYILIKNVV
jgi:hypothetical protein